MTAMTNIQWVGITWAGTLIALILIMWIATRTADHDAADRGLAQQRRIAALRRRRDEYKREARAREQVQ